MTPAPTQRNLDGDSLSDIPTSPTVVVAIRISGPTSASDEFTTRALSIWFNLSISSAAQISMVPEVNRSDAMVSTILFSTIKMTSFANLIVTSFICKLVCLSCRTPAHRKTHIVKHLSLGRADYQHACAGYIKCK